MRTKTGPNGSADKHVKEIKRKTRRQFSAEEKIRIVLDGLRGESSISELCRREGIAESLYYNWSKDFMEAGKKRLAGDTTRQATSSEVTGLKREARNPWIGLEALQQEPQLGVRMFVVAVLDLRRALAEQPFRSIKKQSRPRSAPRLEHTRKILGRLTDILGHQPPRRSRGTMALARRRLGPSHGRSPRPRWFFLFRCDQRTTAAIPKPRVEDAPNPQSSITCPRWVKNVVICDRACFCATGRIKSSHRPRASTRSAKGPIVLDTCAWAACQRSGARP